MTPADAGARIEATLADLRTPVRVVSAVQGPSFTRYGLRPEPGVRVSRVLRLGADLALALGVETVRLEPDADAIGLEVPRVEREMVALGPLMSEADWPRSPIAFAVGRDVAGRPHVADLARMPHLLIAGATGSGKSVAVNVLLTSMLQRSGPGRLRLVLIDAKRVELAP
jgi:S-DNA-T family DNA segregation ATPase FtsK/SpoIIIE